VSDSAYSSQPEDAEAPPDADVEALKELLRGKVWGKATLDRIDAWWHRTYGMLSGIDHAVVEVHSAPQRVFELIGRIRSTLRARDNIPPRVEDKGMRLSPWLAPAAAVVHTVIDGPVEYVTFVNFSGNPALVALPAIVFMGAKLWAAHIAGAVARTRPRDRTRDLVVFGLITAVAGLIAITYFLRSDVDAVQSAGLAAASVTVSLSVGITSYGTRDACAQMNAGRDAEWEELTTDLVGIKDSLRRVVQSPFALANEARRQSREAQDQLTAILGPKSPQEIVSFVHGMKVWELLEQYASMKQPHALDPALQQIVNICLAAESTDDLRTAGNIP